MGDVEGAARQVADSDGLEHGVRAGLVAYGVVHLLIAWLGFQLALGDNEGSADAGGAMRQLSEQPFGGAAIWAVAAGMAALVVWRLLDAAVGHRREDGARRAALRLASLGKAVIYGTVCVSALKVSLGSGSSSSTADPSATARLMDLPAGTWLVAAVGVAVIGYGVRYAVRGLTEGFAEHLSAEGRSGDVGRLYLSLGKVGYVAKGAAIAAVGGLFVYAGVSHDADRSGGLDEALRTVVMQPFGPSLLGAIALGFAAYGLFCFARARHLAG